MISKAKAHIRRLLPKNAFARGVGVLVGGTASAQLITILAAPLLTRLYSPEDFGLLAVYASLLALIGVIASLRYELAIPLPEDDAEAANIVALCLLLVGVTTLLTVILVLLAGPSIAEGLGVPAIASYLWLLPVGVLLGGAYNVFHYWAVRTKRFTTIAGTKLRQALATVAIQLVAFKLGGIALLVGQVAGQSVGISSLSRPTLVSRAFSTVRWRRVVKAARKHYRFPLFTTWAGLLNTAGTHLNTILIAALFGANPAGLYALAHRVLNAPLSIFGEAIRSVFYGNAAQSHRDATLANQIETLFAKLTQFITPILLIVAAGGDDIFSLVFGERWQKAGQLASYMTPWLLMQFCVGPLISTFAVIEKHHIGLLLQAKMFLVRITAIAIGATLGNIEFTVILFSATSALSYLVFLAAIAHYTGARLPTIFRAFLQWFGSSLAVTLPILCYFLMQIESKGGLPLLFLGIFLTLAYYSYFLFTTRETSPSKTFA